MRIRRLELVHYRGIEQRTLEFPTSGVTVVEGPNEVGKSSIAEALDTIFNYYDSTRNRAVVAIQPVDKDVATEIEVEVETGAYVFVYRKRFFKRPSTVLRVLTPRAQTFKGRQAHDRALEILEETIDLNLWRAMQVRQDQPVGQAALHEAQSLAQALDRAAGQESAGDREASLFAKVYDEYAIYFTDTGLSRKPLKESAAAVQDAAERRDQVARELRALERDVDRSEELRLEIDALGEEVRSCQETLTECARASEALQRRESGVKHLQLNAKTERLHETTARNALDLRRRLVARAEDADRKRRELESAAAERRPALKAAEAEFHDGKAALQAAEEAARDAQALADLREKDFDFQRAKLNFEQLGERRARIDAAQRSAADARTLLEQNRLDDALLDAVETAHLAHVEAQARLDAASPRLTLRALTAFEAEVDGEATALAAGDTLDRQVAERFALRARDLFELDVTAGTSVEELLDTRDRARDQLAALLVTAGVESVGAARLAHAERREAERHVAEAERIVEENLRDLTLGELDEKRERLRAWVDGYRAERPAEPPAVTGHDEAYRVRVDAKEEAVRCAAARDEARRRFEEARDRLDRAREQAHAVDIRLRLADEEAQGAAAELEAARAERSDDVLAADVAAKAELVREAEAVLRTEQEALEASHPERLRRRETEAQRLVDGAAARLRQAEDELREVSARLDLLGEKGLFEALQEAQTEHERLRLENGALVRRAAAARVLYTTMSEEREAARRAYAAPLRDEIVKLSRYVFDDSLHVDLDEELRIATRTLGGRTLPFQDLSTGAREQLSLIGRIACAHLVDPQDGVPIIFDDTLGHSDPGRLAGMGALLARAGETAQIIVLTCTPGRFRHVPNAKVIKLV